MSTNNKKVVKVKSEEKRMMQVRFVIDKETTGSVRYREIDQNNQPIQDYKMAKIGAFYIRKDALTGKHPVYIQVTIEEWSK